MKPNLTRSPRASNRGFTLTELLVVITIVAVLAAIAFTFGSKTLKSAHISAEVANLRQAGQSITLLATDTGYYPMGWDGNRGTSWAGLVARDINGEDSNLKQVEFLWSPVLKVKVPLDDPIETVTHYTCNPSIMTDVDGNSTASPKAPKFIIRPSNLLRPAEQILLASGVPRTEGDIYKRAHAMPWQLRGKIGGNGGGGNPPNLWPNAAEKAISFPDDIKELTSGSLPDFNRYGDGKGRFFFVDGHVQVMSPDEHKQKHWAVSY